VGVFGGPPSGEGGLRTGEQEESREPSPSERSSGSLPTETISCLPDLVRLIFILRLLSFSSGPPW